MDYRRYNETQMVDILGGFQRYYATRYLEFKNDLKGHLTKHGESTPPSSILTEHWSKYIEYFKDPYVQVLKYFCVINTL